MNFLLCDMLDQHAKWMPDEFAVGQGRTSFSWQQLNDRVTALAAALVRRGIRDQDRIAVLSDNAVDLVVLQYALSRFGAILVPINNRLTADDVAFILDDSDPVLFLYSAPYAATAKAAERTRAGGGERTESCAVHEREDADGVWEWVDDWVAEVQDSPPVTYARPDWDKTVAILYTGGTTGRSKGAEISHRRNVLDALSVATAFGYRRSDRFLLQQPLSHTSGWDYIKTTFVVGGSVVIIERFDPEVVLHEIERWHCTAMWGVPLVLRRLLESPSFRTTDLSSMRLIAYSAFDPTDVVLAAVSGFRAQGAQDLRIAHGYGLTEGGPFITINRPEDAMTSTASLGIPVPGVLVELLDEQGQAVPRGSAGEICVRTGATMTGYWRNEEATADAFRGGWLHTGDIGRINEAGHLVLVDRAKDIIRTAGENVYAKEVEQALVGHDDVEDCAVIGQRDPQYDERVVAIVVTAPGSTATEQELRSFLRDRLAHYKVPQTFLFRPELPKTAAGKTNKPQLRKLVGSTFTVEPTPTTLAQTV